jgi:diphosphate--fructose-6-phosphate 1-phosphotransferase
MADCLASKYLYHFVRVMGRSASHIALECALQTRANCVLIGEEVERDNMTLQHIVNYVTDIICNRAALDKNYGVILVPEGLIEFIPEMKVLINQINEILAVEVEGDVRAHVITKLETASKALFELLPQSISDQLLLDRDPHGNVQVAKIETEKLLILCVEEELKKRGDY